jgi:hypothetical protein
MSQTTKYAGSFIVSASRFPRDDTFVRGEAEKHPTKIEKKPHFLLTWYVQVGNITIVFVAERSIGSRKLSLYFEQASRYNQFL